MEQDQVRLLALVPGGPAEAADRRPADLPQLGREPGGRLNVKPAVAAHHGVADEDAERVPEQWL